MPEPLKQTMKIIKTVGVVGAGTMGSALAQKFAQEGFHVILADRELQFVENGLDRIKRMFNDGIEKRVFSSAQVDSFLANLNITTDLNHLKACDLIIEAIFENFQAKAGLFKSLSEILPAETILATNTSSFSVSELSDSVAHPERFLGLHYFYHAAKNRLVEIIPGKKTSDETVTAAYRFSILSGKDPIFTSDQYGFAVNRFFVPWLNEAVRLLEEDIASIEEIDSVCMKLFGIGMGPFALMNATGVPIALHAQQTLETFGPSYKVARRLVKQVEKKENWEIGIYPQTISEKRQQQIAERMLGVVFFVCSQLLEEQVCSAIDLNKGAKIGLKWKNGPVELMKRSGESSVRKTVLSYCNIYGEKLPDISEGKWQMDFVLLEIKNSNAIITMNRPEELNALNEEVVKQLDEKFTLAEEHPGVKNILITGSGKAFVAGADIRFFVTNIRNNTLDNIIRFTRYGQEVFEKIDKSEKNVIAVINGMALGGGLELALCADLILALPKAQMAFPETGIGIYPGLGGTQRSVRKIGKGLSKYLIHTGKMISSCEAFEIGLIDRLLSIDEWFLMLEGKLPIDSPKKRKLSENWKSIQAFFETHSLSKILNRDYHPAQLKEEDADIIVKTIKLKAPIALRLADELITKEEGCRSELMHLKEIFSTSDALLGLTSIGKKVTYQGK